MYILFGDETNLNPTFSKKFFIYGGLIVPIEEVGNLNDEINQIRKKYDFKPGDTFKFNISEKPKHINKEDFAKAKEEVFQTCSKHKCILLTYLISHKIATEYEKRILWAIDHIVGRFNKFLNDNGAKGICLLDNISIKSSINEYLSSKFQNGLKLEDKTVSLDNITMLGMTCNNASNISSACDIIIGSFRYCVNDFTNEIAAKKMLRMVYDLMWKKKDGDKFNIINLGVTIRPSKIVFPNIKKDYDELMAKLNKLFQ